jgi:hypothetical protein
VVDEESPAHLAKMLRMWPAENHVSNRRVDPVRSDNEVVRARRTISEDNVDLVRLLIEPRHGRAKADFCPLEKNAMELTASDAQAGASRTPELCELNFRQVASCVIQNSLMCHTGSWSQLFVRQTEHPEGANAIFRGHIGQRRHLAAIQHAR